MELHVLFLFGFAVSSCFAFNFSIGPPDYSNMVDYRGNASISSTSLQLTTNSLDADTRSSMGRAYYRTPFTFGADTSFSTWFTFQITYLSCSGDGLTFLIVPRDEDVPPGSAGMFLGLLNSTTQGNVNDRLFAVEFDTFANPEIDVQTGPHVGVDVNSVNSTFSAAFPLNGSLQAWIDYDSSTSRLEVRIARTLDPWPINALISEVIFLDDVLRGGKYVGFSGSTGHCFETHRVFRWNFSTWEEGPSNSTCTVQCKGVFSCNRVPIIASVLGSILLIGVTMLIFWWFCQRKPIRRDIRQSLSHFSYSELKEATNGFNDDRVLGSGGYGKVYRADFRDSTLAVKVLKEGSMESEHQFLAELTALSEFQHPNLLGLKGWGHARSKMMLVYDYMPNGSLDKHLFSKASTSGFMKLTPKILEWNQRVKIITGVAEALRFLHEGRTIHRDIKTPNVLLDKDFNAKLGDFGLARLINEGEGLQTMTKVGTFGYIAPELAYAGRATDKSDVYSFGILILELVAGIPVLHPQLQREQGITLLEWVWLMHEKKTLLEVIDVRMISEKTMNAETWISMLYLGMWCCSLDPTSRPTMKECCEMLKGKMIPPDPLASRPTYLFSSMSSLDSSSRVPSSYRVPLSMNRLFSSSLSSVSSNNPQTQDTQDIQ